MADLQVVWQSMELWLHNIWDKLTGWIPSWEDITKKWDDMGAKVDLWKEDMKQWFVDMWDKLTGWIPSIEDIKSAGGDLKQWVKDITRDIKLWFWDSSKPQIIGIDLSNLAAAMPSIEDLKQAIFSVLPEWLQPDSIEEAQQKEMLKATKKKDFFDKDKAGWSEIDRSKIDKVTAEELQALLALEGEDIRPKDIEFIENQIKLKTKKKVETNLEDNKGTELIHEHQDNMTEKHKGSKAVNYAVSTVSEGDHIEHKQTVIVPSDVDDKSAAAKAKEMRGL